MSTHRKLPKVALLGASLLAVFVALQCVRPELTNPPVLADLEAPTPVKEILRTACYNCHSNETRLPWFDQVVPAYWLVARDVKRGRAALNFSDFSRLPTSKQKALLYESINQVRLGAMPPRAYSRVHPEAVLDAPRIELIEKYLHPAEPVEESSLEQVAAATRQYEAWSSSVAPHASVPPAPNGLPFFSDYANWKAVSTTDRFDNHTLRLVLANDIAERAIAAHQIQPWPDGSAFAKVAWDQLVAADGTVQPGAFKQVEFMLKNAQKYAATEGWGFGRWLGSGHEPYGKAPDFDRECTGCHAPMARNDFVYTLPITASHAEESADLFNTRAALATSLSFQPLDWRVITLGSDLRHNSMFTLFGNDVAVDHARTAPNLPYPMGAVLARVVWAEQDDAHWFGARIAGAVASVEFVEFTAGSDAGTAVRYSEFAGASLAPVRTTEAPSLLAAPILRLRASILP